MKTLKKALSIILCLALMLSCVAGMQISASAEGEETGETTSDIVISTNTECNFAGRDDQEGYFANVEVSLAEATSFASLGLKVQYDSNVVALSYVSDDYTKLNADFSCQTSEKQTDNPYTIVWYNEENLPVEAGKIAYFNFMYKGDEIPEDFTTTVTVTPFDPFDQDGNPLSLNAESFTVTFLPPVAEECAHEWDAGVVTTQPTKDAEGVMTYTCGLCGETKTEAIAKPVATTAVTFKQEINVSSVVGTSITVSTKQMRTAYGDDASYFIAVDYQKYGTGYVLGDKSKVLTAADRLEGGVSTANKDVILFKETAIYEMTLNFTMTVYFVNGTGVVVGYKTLTTNIIEMALALAPSAGTNLLTALADMCVYGDAAQNHFAKLNPGTAICDATLPSEIFADYMSNASSTEGMPAAGEYNNDGGSTKINASTGFISGGQTLNIGASNRIQYTLRYDNYDWDDVKIVVTYEDSVYGNVEYVVSKEELIANGTAGNGQPKYLYYFGDLALYDCDKTVTMNMYYKGELELTSVYSIGKYVNANLSNPDFAPILTALQLFSNSVGVQLNLPARW